MNKKALRERAKIEHEAAASKHKPGSVVVTFIERVTWPPFWKFWQAGRDEHFKTIYLESGVAFPNAELVQIQAMTSHGPINRVFNWRDITTVLSIPAIPPTTPGIK